MIDRDYGKPDFPSYSDGFDSPRIPPFISTELENTDTFGVTDIFNLGFLRSNPERKIYIHKDKPSLTLEEVYNFSYAIKDRVVRFIHIYYKKSMTDDKIDLYFSSIPKIEDIQKIIDDYED